MWLVGDHFLKEIIHAHHVLRQTALVKKQLLPFLFGYCNVKDYYTKAGITGIARMIAPLVEAFNDNRSDPLPKYIIMLPDNDIITSLKSKGIHTALVMRSTLHYLICQIDMLVDRHMQELVTKKPDAVLPDYPKIVWVRMLKCPAADMNNSSSYREKFQFHTRGTFV